MTKVMCKCGKGPHYWIKEPYTPAEQAWVDSRSMEKFPPGYDPDWALGNSETCDESKFWEWFGSPTSMTFLGAAPHRPTSPAAVAAASASGPAASSSGQPTQAAQPSPRREP